MSKDVPNFAMLIGKSKPGSSSDEPVDHASDLGVKDGMDKEGVENSALKDLMSALSMKDVAGAKMALKDFLEACYPNLAEEGSESPEEESSEQDDEESEPQGY